MIVKPELETIVTPTDQVSLTAGMAVMLTSVCRSVTVSLSLTTRLLWSTAPPTIVIPPGTSLARPRLQGRRGLTGSLTAVVPGVIVRSELVAVVLATDQAWLAVRVRVTVPLSLSTGS